MDYLEAILHEYFWWQNVLGDIANIKIFLDVVRVEDDFPTLLSSF